MFRLPNQTYFDVLNGTGAVAFSPDAKYLATLSKQSPQVILICSKMNRKKMIFSFYRLFQYGIGQLRVKDHYVD
jgi:hypothetical protein